MAAARSTRSATAKLRSWLLVALTLAACESREPQREPVTTRRAAPSDAAIDHLAQTLGYARKAEADGKLDIAIAAYEEALRLAPSAEYAYRLGELHQRAARPAQAIAWFQRYMELAPEATDRFAVMARMTELAGATAPRDAGVSETSVRKVGGPVSRKQVPPDAAVAVGPLRKCYCYPGHGNDRSHFKLCRGRAKNPLCRCGGQDQRALCPTQGTRCDGTDVGCFDGLMCSDPTFGQFTAEMKGGEPCEGFRHGRDVIQGTFQCQVCDPALGLVFEGRPGDECTGYAFTTGKPIAGHLNNCFL